MRILNVYWRVDLRERRRLGRLERLGRYAAVNPGAFAFTAPRNVTHGDVLSVLPGILNVPSNVLNVEVANHIKHVAAINNKQDHYYCLYTFPRCRSTQSHHPRAHTPRRILNVLNVLDAYRQSPSDSPGSTK
jgi:hypothetical protein